MIHTVMECFIFTRPWLNIPGKCVKCFDIDSSRRNTSDKAVLEALKQCHGVRRGRLLCLKE
jgi:hypothetical protein